MPANTAQEPIDKQLLQDHQTAAQRGSELVVIDKTYGDGLPYQRDRLLNETRFYLAQAQMAVLEAGKRLIILREHESPSEFWALMERNNMPRSTISRMMQAAAKFSANKIGQEKSEAIVQLGKTKMFELLAFDDEEIAEFCDGGTVAGLSFDEVSCMTTSELRAALRDARETHARQLADKNEKIDDLDAKLSTAQKSALKVRPWPERWSEIKTEIDGYATAGEESIGKLLEIHAATTQLLLTDPEYDRPELRSVLAQALVSTANRMAERVALLQSCIEDEFADLIQAPRHLLRDPVTLACAE